MAEESNKELEDWVNMFCDFDSFCDEETKRLEESGLMYGIIYDYDFSDYALSYSWASFELKKEDLKDYVFVNKLSHCKQCYEDDYINRTYKFIRMEGEHCAIFYRDY